MKEASLFFLIFSCFCLQNCTNTSENTLLHISSPIWEDQILYFIVTDRFMDGDSTNNDQGAGEYKKGDGKYWNGGDLRGITNKLDYIKELGATGIWITPPVANQWISPDGYGTGNHGYWASNFMEVDRHFGTLEDYKELSRELHRNQMCLIQDVVVNHMGDFFTYTGDYDPNNVKKNFLQRDIDQPSQDPFNHNNALDPEDLEMGVYHFTPSFNDHSDTIKKRLYQFADLDDLNTSNPLVREALRKSYNYWIKEVGVDGYRFDTPIFVEHEFWHDFMHSTNKDQPGIIPFAKKVGKKDFFTFGETLIPDGPFDDEGAKQSASYLGTKNKPEIGSILNFPLYFSIQRVFQELKATNLMTYRLESNERIFEHPERLVNFIDNHDGARFLAKADQASFRQALLFIMTIPGVPVIYYGTEQELNGTRQAMFKGGSGSPDQAHFKTESSSFKFLQSLIQLRKENDLFRHGSIKVLRDASDGPGIFAYQLTHQDETAIVVLNTSKKEKLITNLSTDLKGSQTLKSKFNLHGEELEYKLTPDGKLNLLLESKAGMVLYPTGDKISYPDNEQVITISPLKNKEITSEALELNGFAKGLENISIFINGDHELAIPVNIDPDGAWSTNIDLKTYSKGSHQITAFHYNSQLNEYIFSNTLEFDLNLTEKLLAHYKDPIGDDHGVHNDYQYPSHPSYTSQMDIAEVKVYARGSNLKIELTMDTLTQEWLPPNGFDHLLVNIYINFPDGKGSQLLPFQNADFPGTEGWDYLISTAGFSNALFSSRGASKNYAGQPVGPTANISVKPEEQKITFLISASALGRPESLNGAEIYINSWGGGPTTLRPLNQKAELWSFGGGKESDPKIMDETSIIFISHK